MPDKRRIQISVKRLQELINQRGWTKADLSRKLGLSKPAVEKWFNGAKPYARRHDSLLDVFGLDNLNQLLGIETKDNSAATRPNNETGIVTQFCKTFDELSDIRRRFWESLRRAYPRHVKSNTYPFRYPAELQALVDAAPRRPDLPVPTGEMLLDYPVRHGRFLTGESFLLYQFSSAVYPRYVHGRDLSGVSIIDGRSFEAFHECE